MALLVVLSGDEATTITKLNGRWPVTSYLHCSDHGLVSEILSMKFFFPDLRILEPFLCSTSSIVFHINLVFCNNYSSKNAPF